MPHPFFDDASFPWHRSDARELLRALVSAVPEPARIDLLYKSSGAGLRPLPMQGSPDLIWRGALDALSAAGRLRALLDLVLADPSLAAIHVTVRIVIEGGEASSPPSGLERSSRRGPGEPSRTTAASTSESGTGSSGQPPAPADLSLLGVLREAVQVVPVVKYALGVAGIGAAAAIVLQFLRTPFDAALGVVGVFLMMVLLLLLASIRRSSGTLHYPSLILIWVTLGLFLMTLALVVTSVFFEYPKPYPEIVDQFKPVRHTDLTVKAVGADGRAVPGALVVAQGRNYRSEQTSAADGSVTLAGIPSTETNLTLNATARGFEEGRLQVNPLRVQAALEIVMAATPESIADQDKPGRDRTAKRPAPPDPLTELRGTWQIVVVGDVSNVRIRRGTFEFAPQRDGEIVVGANFNIDGMSAELSGRATLVRSQLFIKFDIKASTGGEWSGTATFSRTALNTLSGRLQAKSGDDVPVRLQKLTS